MPKNDLLLIEENKSTNRLRYTALGCACFAVTIGVVTLAGWIFDVPILRTFHPGWVSMKVNSAAALMAAGAALLLYLQPGRGRFSLAMVFTVLVFAVGAVTFFEYLSGYDLGIDQLFFQDPASFLFPGRMAPATAINLVLTAAALFFIPFRLAIVSQILSLALFCRAFTAILGYLYGAPALFKDGVYTAMSFHTALCFAALGIGIFFARPSSGYAARLCIDDLGGSILRRLFLPTVALLVVLGWLPVVAQNIESYSTGLGIAILVLITTDCFGYLIWRTAAEVSKAERKRNGEFALVLETSRDAIISLSADGKITSCNGTAESAFGYDAQEMQRCCFFDLLSPGSQDAAKRIFHDMKLGRTVEVFETEGRLKDGTSIPLSVYMAPLLDIYGDVFAAMAVVRRTQGSASETFRKRILF